MGNGHSGSDASDTIGRREAIKKGAIGAAAAGVVWSAPRIEGLNLRPNYAAAASGAGGPFNFTIQLLPFFLTPFDIADAPGLDKINVTRNPGGVADIDFHHGGKVLGNNPMNNAAGSIVAANVDVDGWNVFLSGGFPANSVFVGADPASGQVNVTYNCV